MIGQWAICLLAAGWMTAGLNIPTAAGQLSEGEAVAQQPAVPEGLDELAEELIAKPNIGALAIVKIEQAEIAWSRYYGEQSPGVAVSETTAFNTASVTKTLLAETILRLVDTGEMTWDDPICAYYEHPDLKDDPRYCSLTPETILSHQAALKNWPRMYDDNKLAFTGELGTGETSYSGAAFDMLARYLEARFETSYPALVDSTVLTPFGIEDITIDRKPWLDGRVPAPVASDGTVYPPMTWYEGGPVFEMGQWSAADNMYATAPAYAKLLVALMKDDKLSADAKSKRLQILSRGMEGSEFTCTVGPENCPTDIGFSIGWQIFAEPDRTVVAHAGGDYSDFAQVYFVPETEEGLVVFMNGGGAFSDGTRVLQLLDPELRMAKHYRGLLDAMEARESDASQE